jgi:hypothetical protein
MRAKVLVLAIIALAASSCGPSGPSEAGGAAAPKASEEPAPLNPDAAMNEQKALASCAPVSADGYCGITFGMAPDAAKAKFPVKLELYSGGDPQQQGNPNRCYELFAVEPVQGISFLVENARVGRLDVLSEGAKTVDGFGVGADGTAIKAKFSTASEARNKYEPEVTDLTLIQGATKFVFEIQDGKVRAWRAGLAPTIDYVEHCG